MADSPTKVRHFVAAKLIPIVAIGVGLIVIGLWILTPVVMSKFYPDMTTRGQAGDVFGSINALFSGLAFMGVIVAILLQREELKLQREELTATRNELARSATAQDQARIALQESIYASAFKAAFEILQTDSAVAARRVVFADLSSKPFSNWSPLDHRAAEKVCSSYDVVGIMCRKGMLPTDYIADSWGDSLRRSWKILVPLVEYQRKLRGAPEFYDDYEFLAQQAFGGKLPPNSGDH